MDRQTRGQRGTASIVTLVTLVALIGAGALGVDAGLVWVARTQAQNVSDSAALAAAANLIDDATNPPTVTRGAARAAADTYAGSNKAVHDSMVLADGDVVFGHWDPVTETFITPTDAGDPEQNTAVQVTTRMDGTENAAVTAFLARVLGRDDFDVRATATGYLGYAGTVGPREVELPIAIDCCKLAGADCRADYCEYIAENPPNECELSAGAAQDEGANTVSCIEFHNTAEQNACWTQFDPDDPSVNTSDLIDIVENLNRQEIGYEDIHVDNGDKTPVIREIYERMHGEGSYNNDPSGVDRYEPLDGQIDSWVTVLPVVECQDENHCGSQPATIVGFVCFELREVIVTPDKIIKGRFLCPSDPLWDECELNGAGTGGLNFGLRAEIPVLVR